MRIGVVGTGDVGRQLASGLLKHGYEVCLGSRSADNEVLKTWSGENSGGKTGTFQDAADFGEAVVIAIGWSNIESALNAINPGTLTNKIVIDVTNPLVFKEEGKAPELAIGFDNSAGEMIQKWLPDANVVKCWNIVGNTHMIDPEFKDGKPDMFICGNDAGAKKTMQAICEKVGWPTIDLGGIEQSRYLEPLAMIWIKYCFDNGFSLDHAFKLLR